jgi:hypothetical protein
MYGGNTVTLLLQFTSKIHHPVWDTEIHNFKHTYHFERCRRNVQVNFCAKFAGLDEHQKPIYFTHLFIPRKIHYLIGAPKKFISSIGQPGTLPIYV